MKFITILAFSASLLARAKCPSSKTYNMLTCRDDTQCSFSKPNCCKKHGGRLKCPPNYPFMCANEKQCSGDHCCARTKVECKRYHGGLLYSCRAAYNCHRNKWWRWQKNKRKWCCRKHRIACKTVTTTGAQTTALPVTPVATTTEAQTTAFLVTPAATTTEAQTTALPVTPAATATVAQTTAVPATPACTTGQFTCANGGCVDGSWRCDGKVDCGDSSDEGDCSILPVATELPVILSDCGSLTGRYSCEGKSGCFWDNEKGTCVSIISSGTLYRKEGGKGTDWGPIVGVLSALLLLLCCCFFLCTRCLRSRRAYRRFDEDSTFGAPKHGKHKRQGSARMLGSSRSHHGSSKRSGPKNNMKSRQNIGLE